MDIGANEGNYASVLRIAGYKGRIVSFEPGHSTFLKLQRRAAQDRRWEVRNCGVGESDVTLTLNIAGNSESSSFLAMEQAHLDAAPQSKFVSQESAQVISTDTMLKEHTVDSDRVFVKADTQGFEKKIIAGLRQMSDRVVGFQLETSLVPLYAGEWLLPDVLREMNTRGYRVYAFQPSFASPSTAEILQVDIFFFR
jgi:FkbM family methyltransferase